MDGWGGGGVSFSLFSLFLDVQLCRFLPCDRSLVVKNTQCFDKFTVSHTDSGQLCWPKLVAQHSEFVKT